MKTAVLLTGHYRTFDQCKEKLIPELTRKFNPDFFVNTYIERYNYHPYVAAALDCTIESHISEDYFSELNYRSSLFDSIDYANTIYEQESRKFNPFMFSNSRSHFLHIWKLFSGLNMVSKYQKEISKEKYDCVVICRMDVVPKNLDDLCFDDYQNSVYLTKSHIPQACDHILISSPNNLFKMCSWMYNEFFCFSHPSSNQVMPHTLFDNAINYNGLSRIDYPILDYVLRYGGTKDIEA